MGDLQHRRPLRNPTTPTPPKTAKAGIDFLHDGVSEDTLPGTADILCGSARWAEAPWARSRPHPCGMLHLHQLCTIKVARTDREIASIKCSASKPYGSPVRALARLAGIGKQGVGMRGGVRWIESGNDGEVRALFLRTARCVKSCRSSSTTPGSGCVSLPATLSNVGARPHALASHRTASSSASHWQLSAIARERNVTRSLWWHFRVLLAHSPEQLVCPSPRAPRPPPLHPHTPAPRVRVCVGAAGYEGSTMQRAWLAVRCQHKRRQLMRSAGHDGRRQRCSAVPTLPRGVRRRALSPRACRTHTRCIGFLRHCDTTRQRPTRP